MSIFKSNSFSYTECSKYRNILAEREKQIEQLKLKVKQLTREVMSSPSSGPKHEMGQ